jgi:hypothetical protein
MSQDVRTAGEPPLDIATVTADDRLLDLLGRGELPAGAVGVAAMLAAWRSCLDDGWSDVDDGRSGVDNDRAAGRAAELAAAAVRRTSRSVRLMVTVAAALVVAAGLTVWAASGAQPGGPLWPITRIAFPDHADVAAAAQAVEQARTAAFEGRYDEARRLVDRADALIARVRSPEDARRLRAALDEVRRMLDALAPGGGGPTATPTPSPGSMPGSSITHGAPGGGSGGAPGGGGSGGVPGLPLPTGTGGPGLPPPPPLPPVPAPPLPTTLPSLPVPQLPGP